MASFPTSVKTFTSKNSGDVIQAAHVNDLQDEVNAVEAGYLQGSARLNSSHSTLAALSVSGGSTLAGTLQVTGASTLGGTVQVTGASTFTVRPITPPPDAAKVSLASTYAAGSSALSTLSFLTQDYLTNSSAHSTGTNPERLVPQSTGLYLFSGQAEIGGAPSAASWLRLTILDSSASAIANCDLDGVISGAVSFQVQGYKRFDTLGGQCVMRFQNAAGGSSMSLKAAATWFSMTKL
jgi:hypothetical protein